jgi:hypothetical protein
MGAAVDLFVEAEAWSDVLGVIRDAGSLTQSPVSPSADSDNGTGLAGRTTPGAEALLAVGLELQTRVPKESLAISEALRRFPCSGRCGG